MEFHVPETVLVSRTDRPQRGVSRLGEPTSPWERDRRFTVERSGRARFKMRDIVACHPRTHADRAEFRPLLDGIAHPIAQNLPDDREESRLSIVLLFYAKANPAPARG
ncbi:MAG: hypothetical protein ABI165_18630, partial [Bryobacteraceae bacterium]